MEWYPLIPSRTQIFYLSITLSLRTKNLWTAFSGIDISFPLSCSTKLTHVLRISTNANPSLGRDIRNALDSSDEEVFDSEDEVEILGLSGKCASGGKNAGKARALSPWNAFSMHVSFCFSGSGLTLKKPSIVEEQGEKRNFVFIMAAFALSPLIKRKESIRQQSYFGRNVEGRARCI